jgi:cytochrome c553
MRGLVLCLTLSVAVAGCTDQKEPAPKAQTAAQAQADVNAGKAYAERECKACHGVDGKAAAPAIPHLAAQRDIYLVDAMKGYKEGRRTHAALRDMLERMSEADIRNVAAYYAGLPPVAIAAGKGAEPVSPYDSGKALAESCVKCHGADGNSTTPGIPTLAGQQPRYFVTAIQEYLAGERKEAPMHSMLRGMRLLEMESLALYFASQTPAQRAAPPVGDPATGEPLTAVCGGCHGPQGMSNDTLTPVLAGQDPRYLVEAIKAYRTTRRREDMRLYVTGLSDRDIEHIAAFYTIQKSHPIEKGQTLIKDLTEKCDRCHGAGIEKSAQPIPKIMGQDKDYLIMALRAYRDDRRESSMMHKMTLPYSDSVIEGISSFYASRPAK